MRDGIFDENSIALQVPPIQTADGVFDRKSLELHEARIQAATASSASIAWRYTRVAFKLHQR